MSNGPLCLSSIFSIVPVLNSIPLVVLFDINITRVYQSQCHFSIATLAWHQYLVLFYEPRKDLEALSYSNKIDKTAYRSCRYY